MIEAVDARGVRLCLERPAQRIVSLVPSTTETLHALGLADKVVGVTRFCVHPQPWVRSVPRVGGTKDVDPERVRALEPDLIVGNCEENTREIFDTLSPIAPLWGAWPKTVPACLHDLLAMGLLTGTEPAAHAWHDRIERTRAEAHAAADSRPRFSYAWLIWRRPWMASGADTFTAALLDELGGDNVFTSSEDRFPAFDLDELVRRQPDRVLLSSEPFPFKAKHIRELVAATGWSEDRFVLVDGELGSWHGVRLAQAFEAWPELTGG